MEEASDQMSDPVIALRGFANAVHIAADFGMSTERDAFVTMLAKYTYLESTKAMRRRNIESFKTLVHIALADGNHLGVSWAPVLKCISECQRLHMIGTGAKTDTQLFFLQGGQGAAACRRPQGRRLEHAREPRAARRRAAWTRSSVTRPTRRHRQKHAASAARARTMVEFDVFAIAGSFGVVAALPPIVEPVPSAPSRAGALQHARRSTRCRRS